MRLGKKSLLGSLVSITAILFIALALQDNVTATSPPETRCLIIISGSGGYSAQELGKASSFYSYMSTKCAADEIVYLTDPSQQGSDGSATVSNIENAFYWLAQNSTAETDVVIYISDHAQGILNEIYLIFDDGNISSTTIDSWLEQVQCSNMTVVMNGERSGLGGTDLAAEARDVLCSMRPYQSYDPDLFNITRGLEDPSADMNDDEIVDFIEAYWKEVENVGGTGQDPVLYHGL